MTVSSKNIKYEDFVDISLFSFEKEINGNIEKITELFKAFSELKESWPAGKTLLAAKQFLTTAEKFEKKFDLYKDGKLLQLGIIPKIGLINIKLWKKSKRKKKNFLIWVS